ncbi:hypothetical protein OPIT5_27840 [Opitutaceae bacterium TAV5]|nr:hypothetical protein OPIT5_27840 [Opitutaceae bacterium TAV5]
MQKQESTKHHQRAIIRFFRHFSFQLFSISAFPS